jgi:hypothetical protein
MGFCAHLTTCLGHQVTTMQCEAIIMARQHVILSLIYTFYDAVMTL